MNIAKATVFLTIFTLASSLSADEIHLRNKDVVRGKIVSLQDKTITFESENFGNIKVDRAKVNRIVLHEPATTSAAAAAFVPPNVVCEDCEDGGFNLKLAEKAPTIQLLFRQPEGIKLQPLGEFDDEQDAFTLPARRNVARGTYRYRVTGVKEHPKQAFVMTLEVGHAFAADQEHLEKNAVPIELSRENFELAASGGEVVEGIAARRSSEGLAALVLPKPPELIKLRLKLEDVAPDKTEGTPFFQLQKFPIEKLFGTERAK